jgi:thiol-disulfide isomerase/thioredoxin
MKTIIESGLQNSMSYEAYRALVNELVKNSSTTGSNKSLAFVNYTKLNDKRMKRWDKTLKVSNAARKIIEAFDAKLTWLVITESWCGDAAHTLPVLNKLAELNDNIDFRVVLRDDNDLLINAFLSNGNKAIPKLIILDSNTNEVLTTYGPRPSEATSYVNRFKVKHGVLTPDFKEDLQHWYNDDKGQNIIDDVIEILNQLQPTISYQ